MPKLTKTELGIYLCDNGAPIARMDTGNMLGDPDNVVGRAVDYVGPGMYSLDDDWIYRMGRFATYSRIRLVFV